MTCRSGVIMRFYWRKTRDLWVQFKWRLWCISEAGLWVKAGLISSIGVRCTPSGSASRLFSSSDAQLGHFHLLKRHACSFRLTKVLAFNSPTCFEQAPSLQWFFNGMFDQFFCILKTSSICNKFSICSLFIQFVYLVDLLMPLPLTSVGLLCHLQPCQWHHLSSLLSYYRIQKENEPRTICLWHTFSSPLQEWPISLRH